MTTILILSCGTRNKLVRFFKEAFHSLPGGGRVIVTIPEDYTDIDPAFIWYRR